MTGAEHYAEAERLLVVAECDLVVAAAQVHATLALAAAVEKQTRMTTGVDDGGYGR